MEKLSDHSMTEIPFHGKRKNRFTCIFELMIKQTIDEGYW